MENYTKNHYSVYVIELDQEVLINEKFKTANLHCEPNPVCLYVGMTGKTPDERFSQHKMGYKACKYVKKYGLYLRRKMFEKYNPMTFEEAKAKEISLALELRKKGTQSGRNNSEKRLTSVYKTSGDSAVERGWQIAQEVHPDIADLLIKHLPLHINNVFNISAEDLIEMDEYVFCALIEGSYQKSPSELDRAIEMIKNSPYDYEDRFSSNFFEIFQYIQLNLSSKPNLPNNVITYNRTLSR